MPLLFSLYLAREVSFCLFAEGENVVPFLDWWFLEGLLCVESFQGQFYFLLPSARLRPWNQKRLSIGHLGIGGFVVNSG